jgi:hypothetical protein
MYSAGLVVYTISFGVLLADLIMAIFKRKVKHLRFFTLLMLASCIYALGFLLQHLSFNYSALLQGSRVQYLGAAFVSPLLLFFIIDFCDIKQRPWLNVSLLIIPVVTVVLVFTYAFNGIYFGESVFATDPIPLLMFSGSVFRTVYFIYSYCLMLAAFIICIILSFKTGSAVQKTFGIPTYRNGDTDVWEPVDRFSEVIPHRSYIRFRERHGNHYRVYPGIYENISDRPAGAGGNCGKHAGRLYPD